MPPLVVLVHIHVKEGAADAFREASLLNARESRLEPGVLRFDVIQQADAPDRFVLIEVYRDAAAAADHKETPHYADWRDTVAGWMAAPRVGVKYAGIDPPADAW